MPAIYVCPKSQVPEVVARIRPSHLVTLLDPADEMPTPGDLPGHRHLRLGMHDISIARPEFTAPDEQHVRELITFAREWDRAQPMLVHCWAGISRSTASAFTIACMLGAPGIEREIALRLRRVAPHAQPNQRIVALADALLSRDGRMLEAVDAMGPAQVAFEGQLFSLSLER
jgi:predicted protein tyrosine phosphatase